ncbi:glycosyltransferase [Paenibacillus sp. LPE1-1-1.1]|uniref:glycosyltransferase n=1 Tax=Paenibacillus sp. LPE1-1-1.1 TaxID=3135230 RepID=UPI003439428C
MLTKRIVFGIEFNSRSTRPAWKIGLTAGWIHYRMSVFMKYTMKSLKKQTNQDFVALIQYADCTEFLIKQELGKYEPLPENIQFVPASKYQENIAQLITGFDRLYLVRLDCDDMYHKSIVQQLRDFRPKSSTQALINQKGYIYDAVRQRFTATRHQSPPFYTLIYKSEEYLKGKRHAIPGGHRYVIKLKHEILTKKGNRNYMIVVHKRNTLNQNLLRKAVFHSNRIKLDLILKNFCKETAAEIGLEPHQPVNTTQDMVSQ